MPKRGGGRVRNWNAANDHFEHDDRTHSNNIRRVSFKPGTNKVKNKFKWNDAKLMLDDDIDMGANQGGQGIRKPFRGRGGRMNSPAPRQHLPKKKFSPGLLSWYQVIIPHGAKHDKEVILRLLLSFLSPDVFIPHYYKINGNAAIFYVDDVKIAEKLFNADRKISMPDGYRMLVIVRNTAPEIVINAELKEKMKLTMAKRYNVSTKALDLTKFHADPDLANIYCALCRAPIMIAAMAIMAENIPDLEALNLNDNKIQRLEPLKDLSAKFKNLKILYLGDNKITSVSHLENVKSPTLVELLLKGNPLEQRFSDHEIYISEVRKRFPKLARLDGVDLPPAIGFDVAEASLPPRQQSFLADPAGQDLVRDFLTQYFALYDSESRQPLLEAYHEHASMSMTANYMHGPAADARSANTNKLNSYFQNSRNILRVLDRDRRRTFLRNGRLQVVTFLSELPKTTHDLMGFAVDLLVFTPTMIVLTMNGVFKETTQPGQPLRSFHRTFVVVPNGGGGFNIINDMLFVTQAAKEQEEKSFTSSISETTSPAPAPAPATIQISDEAKSMMLVMLGQQTGMNEHWSMNCLQETGWDLQKAVFIFNHLQSEGKIPQEAFIK